MIAMAEMMKAFLFDDDCGSDDPVGEFGPFRRLPPSTCVDGSLRLGSFFPLRPHPEASAGCSQAYPRAKGSKVA